MDERRLEPIGASAGTLGSRLARRLDDATTLQKGKTYEIRLRLLTKAMLDSPDEVLCWSPLARSFQRHDTARSCVVTRSDELIFESPQH